MFSEFPKIRGTFKGDTGVIQGYIAFRVLGSFGVRVSGLVSRV